MKTTRAVTGPLRKWAEAFDEWMRARGYSAGHILHCGPTVARFSQWMADQGHQGLSHEQIDDYIASEQQRCHSRSPSAATSLPTFRRFMVEQGVLTDRPVLRSLGGVPRRDAGTLRSLMPALVGWLQVNGYQPGTVSAVAGTAARLGQWMASEGLRVEELSEEWLARFVEADNHHSPAHASVNRRIVTVGKFLNAFGLLAPAQVTPVEDLSPVAECLRAFCRYSRLERGNTETWVREQRHWLTGLVEELDDGTGSLQWDKLSVGVVNAYIHRQCHGYSVSSARHAAASVRTFLGWAYRSKLIKADLRGGVHSMGKRRQGLPQALNVDQVERLKAAADRSTPAGSRDYAILVLMARLGLRASEVANLRLDDLDWANGTLRATGKSGRLLELPIPEDVGQALTDYLRHGRPSAALERTVFIRLRPPLIRLTGKGGVSAVISKLAAAAGLSGVHAHQLRHTAATNVLASGGNFTEARQLLGHAFTETTMIYARINTEALSELAPVWGRLP